MLVIVKVSANSQAGIKLLKQFFGNFKAILLKKRFPFVFVFQHCAVIEVTDGWYGIQTILDRPLTRLLHDGKITVGQKLFVYGAELIGSEQAVSPLEVHFRFLEYVHTAAR